MNEHMEKFLQELSLKPKADGFEAREYQINIAKSILMKGNSLVIMPTALGKTFVIVLVIAKMVREMNEGKRARKKFLFLTPTKPLALQQRDRILELIEFDWENKKGMELANEDLGLNKNQEGIKQGDGPVPKNADDLDKPIIVKKNRRRKNKNEEISEVMLMTGEMSPIKREALWNNHKINCYTATPQTVEFDLLAGRMKLEDFALVVFDEAHRAVKEYSYSFVAKEAGKANAVLVGLTASPSSKREIIDEICMNLGIQNIEIRDDSDSDVRKYSHEIKMDWIFVDLPKEFAKVREGLQELLREVLERLKEMGALGSTDIKSHKRELMAARQRALQNLKADIANYQILSLHARAMNISHAIDLIEIEGLHSLLKFMQEMEGREKQSKAVRELLKDSRWLLVQHGCMRLIEQGLEHPKFAKLLEVLKGELKGNRKAIVFAHFRNTVKKITEELGKLEGCRPVEFIGKSNAGMGQKQQHHVMQQFREGVFNVLVATSVGEEGLDIPDVELVVFFEAVPSEIRLIQRRGRTGRVKEGKAIILVTKNTRDEAFFWISRNREKKMRKVVEGIRREGFVDIESSGENPTQSQQRLFDF